MPSLVVRRLSYNASDVIVVFYLINLRRILPVFKCYKIIAILKALSYINETPETPL